MGKLEDLAETLLDLNMKKAEIDSMIEQVKGQFIEALKAENKYDENTKAVGDVRVRLIPNRWFDVEEAFTTLPKKLQKEVLVSKPDPKLVKMHLTPIQLEEHMRSYDVPFKLSVAPLEIED